MNRTRRRLSARRGMTTLFLIAMIIVLAAAAGAVWWYVTPAATDKSDLTTDHFATRRGSFDIVVPTSGELAAIRQIEIRNELEQRATITAIADEGVHVAKGDLLIQFNDEDIRNNIKDAEDDFANAENQLENAKANLEIAIKTRESELAKADLEVTLTELAMQSWEEGEVVETRQNLQLDLKTAQMEYDRLKERFEASKRLYEKEFISLDEYKQDEIALVRADTNLKQAQLAIEIYEKYDYKQQREQKESDRDQAVEERDRIKQRNDAEVRSAESDVHSAERMVESRQERLDKWTRQLDLCAVHAPSGGLVVYAASLHTGGHGRNDEDPPMVGTDVPSKKTIMILPDTSEMIAEVKVNEALSGQIKSGQTATVVSDALPDVTLHGTVTNVGVLAETGGFRDPNRRDYTVKIHIDDYSPEQGLKPSMRCRADINVGRVTDAYYVPIQAVHRRGDAAYVWVPDGRGFSQKLIDVGEASEMYVEVTDGLVVGQIVLLHEPDPARIVSTLKLPDAPVVGAELVAHEPSDAELPPADSLPEADGAAPAPGNGESAGGMNGRPSREQMQEMLKNMTPEQQAEWRQRMRDRRNRNGGDGGNRPPRDPAGGGSNPGSGSDAPSTPPSGGAGGGGGGSAS